MKARILRRWAWSLAMVVVATAVGVGVVFAATWDNPCDNSLTFDNSSRTISMQSTTSSDIANYIYFYNGADQLSMGQGNDEIHMGSGNDKITFHSGDGEITFGDTSNVYASIRYTESTPKFEIASDGDVVIKLGGAS